MASSRIPPVFVESLPLLNYDEAPSARTFFDDVDVMLEPNISAKARLLEPVVAVTSPRSNDDATTTASASPSSTSGDDDDMMRSLTTPTSVRRTSKFKFRVAAHSVVASERFANHPETKRSYDLDRGVSPCAIEQIDMDLPRTGDDPIVRARLGRIRAVLLQYAAEDAQLGYCQGMNYVAAAFTAASKSQAEAYRRFHKFVEELRGLWMPGFPLLQTGSVQFERLVEDRPWYIHICSLDVHTSMFLPQAWLTSFAAWLPLESLVTCLGFLELHGFPSMLALAVAVLDTFADKLLQQTTMEGTLQLLSSLRSQVVQAQTLKAHAKALMPTVFAMPSRPSVHLAVDESIHQRIELPKDEKNEEDLMLSWTSSSSQLLQWAEAETVSAGIALFRWAMSEPGNTSNVSSSRMLFVSSASGNLMRRTEA